MTSVNGELTRLFLDKHLIYKQIIMNRCEYQGMKPPSPRDERYFDPGTKFHVALDVSYIK